MDLFPRVDPRYPDIIATVSNALHFLNKSGFDHDRDHHHASAFGYNEDDEHSRSDSAGRSSVPNAEGFAVKVEDNDLQEREDDGSSLDGMLTPGASDSEDDCSSEEEEARAAAANGLASPPDGDSHPHAHRHQHSHEHGHGSHRRSTSTVVREGDRDGLPDATSAALPSELPDVPQVSPPVDTDNLGPLQPEHTATVPTPGHQRSDHSSPEQSPQPGRSPQQHKDSLSDRRHRRIQSDTRFLSPTGVSTPPTSQSGGPGPHSPRSPSSPSAGSVSPRRASASRASASSPPPQPMVETRESSTSSVKEDVSELETETSRVTTVTTTTTTVHTRTTTVMKQPQPQPETETAPAPAAEWTPSEQSQLLEEILIFYVDLYWENQHSFAPFYRRKLETRHDLALMVYRHLFQDEKFKSQSKKLLKEPLVTFFEDQITKKSQPTAAGLPLPAGAQQAHAENSQSRNQALPSPSSDHFASFADITSPTPPAEAGSSSSSGAATPSTLQAPQPQPEKRRSSFSLPNPLALFSPPHKDTAEEQETEQYVQRVNAVCQELHRQYLIVASAINAQLVQQLLTPRITAHVSNVSELNRAMVGILHSPEILQLLSVYHPQYQQAVVSFPGRILMSRTLRHRIESSAYIPLTFTDTIVAVNEITEILRKAFQKIAGQHPDMIQQLVASKRLVSLRELHAAGSAERERKRDKGGYPESFSSWLYDSRVYPKLLTEETFHILAELNVKDAKVFHLISEHRLQEALWRLRDLNLDDEAVKLEAAIDEQILGDQAAAQSGVENLGGGFTTTKLINFPLQDIRGVYKPKTGSFFTKSNFRLQTLKDSMVSNYKKEIAAYKIDRLLRLNHVPITKMTHYHGEKGSLQYFISDATVARNVNDVDIHNPQKSGKWSASKGRTELPRTIKMFDWFINNRDRNLDNYLISDDGRVVLIDHGWTFVAPTTAPTKDFLKKLIPKQSVYENVKALHDNEKLIDDELKDLLGSRNLASFKSRLRTFVHFVEKRIKKKGVEATFKEAEEQDWKPPLD